MRSGFNRAAGRRAAAWAAALWVTCALPASSDEPDVAYGKPRAGAFQELGLVRRAMMVSTPVGILKDEWIDHFGSFVSEQVTVAERLAIEVGLGGVFQFPKPEKIEEEFGGSQYKMFFVGPTVAEAMYSFAGPAQGRFSLGGGLFPYKYNPDASNLGEYLFRSGPYPTYLTTGGLAVIGDNAAQLQGFRAQARLGDFGLDLLLTTETGMPPLYDWSLAAVSRYAIADGLFEIGAGIDCKRFLPVRPSRTSRREMGNAYFYRAGKAYVGDPDYYRQRSRFWQYLKMKGAATAADSAVFQARGDSLAAIADSVGKTVAEGGWLDSATGLAPGARFYTTAGTLLMARASLDLKKVFPSARLSAADFRLYAEAALLGWKDYPVYYEHRRDRIPIMAGFNVPTWGLLDLLSVQGEYFPSPNLDNTYPLGLNNYATPYQPEGSDPLFSRAEYNDLTRRDDFAWSILARKEIASALHVDLQMARDHLRTVGTDWYYGGRLEPAAVLSRSTDWYLMLQIGWTL